MGKQTVKNLRLSRAGVIAAGSILLVPAILIFFIYFPVWYSKQRCFSCNSWRARLFIKSPLIRDLKAIRGITAQCSSRFDLQHSFYNELEMEYRDKNVEQKAINILQAYGFDAPKEIKDRHIEKDGSASYVVLTATDTSSSVNKLKIRHYLFHGEPEIQRKQ